MRWNVLDTKALQAEIRPTCHCVFVGSGAEVLELLKVGEVVLQQASVRFANAEL